MRGRNAVEVPNGTVLSTDVAIVGAGPAGLTVARGLRSRGHRVILLEAGGDSQGMDDDVGVVRAPGGAPYDLRRAYFQGVGGGSRAWYQSGWKARPLEPEDFEERSFVAESGWPISLSSLVADYGEAQRVCELGPYRYQGPDWPEYVEQKDIPGQPELVHPIFQLGPYGAFTRIAERLSAEDGFELLTHAKVVAVRHRPGEFAECLEVVAGRSRRFFVEAKAFVLSCGGFNVPRLMLVSSLGNEHDLVGRYFQEHLHATSGYIEHTNPHTAQRLGGRLVANDGTGILGSLALSREVREKHGLMGCALWLEAYDRADVSPAMRSINRFRARWGGARKLPEDWMTRLRVIASDPQPIARKLAIKTGLESREYVSVVRFESECEPQWDSRIFLTEERDDVGMPKATLEWKIGPNDERSVRESMIKIGQILEKVGYGRLVEPWGDEWPRPALGGGSHHMGTTRMHHRPEKGVVDADARVHSSKNVFVASSAVFTTSGFANPTLTIVALANRLARHLDSVLAVPSSITAEV